MPFLVCVFVTEVGLEGVDGPVPLIWEPGQIGAAPIFENRADAVACARAELQALYNLEDPSESVIKGLITEIGVVIAGEIDHVQ